MNSSTLKPVSRDLAPLAQHHVATLFEELAFILGTAKMGTMFAGLDAEGVRATWARGLAGFTKTEILRGLAEAGRAKFPPTLGEFAHWCRPALDPEVSWLEAEHGLMARDRGELGDWTHPAIWRAACTLSAAVRSGDFQRHRNRWAYEVKWELSRGLLEGVPAPAMRIENDARTGPPPEEVRARLAKIKAEAQSALAEKALADLAAKGAT